MEEQGNEGIVEGENKGKENVLIGKDEEDSKWTKILREILVNIMNRLKLSDCLRTSAVCSSWKAIYKEAIANNYIKPLPELPLVILQSRRESGFTRSVLSIKSEEICSVINIKAGLPENCHVCHGIVEGWMILSTKIIKLVGTSLIIFFLNPVTSDVVIVPPPLRFPSISNLKIGRIVASSSPKCEDCVLVCLFTGYTHLACCRVNYDKSWTMIEAEKWGAGKFLDVEIFNGKLYVRTKMLRTCVVVYDLQDCTDNPPKPIVLGNAPALRPSPEVSRHENQMHVKGNAMLFLTRGYASEELLLIYMYCNYVYETSNIRYMNIIKEYASSPEVIKCEVFKLDIRSNEWVKLDDLGDRVIFLGNGKSLVMSRTLLNCNEELIGENTVYFALYFQCSEPRMTTQLGRICLSDNNVKYFSLEELGAELDAYPYPFWFLPSVW